MPSVSGKQRRYMGMQLARQRATGHNATGMSEGQLRDFARGSDKRSRKSDRVSRTSTGGRR